MADEIDTELTLSKDQTEMTIKLKAGQKLSTQAVILELEYLINELSRADEEKARPDHKEH